MSEVQSYAAPEDRPEPSGPQYPPRLMQNGDESSRPSRKPKPSRVLPSARLAFDRQLDVLRAYAVLSDGSKPVSNRELSEVVKIAPSTVSTGNPFFADVGLIVRAETAYVASPEVVQFQRAYAWSPETAVTRLSPLLERSWFGQRLLQRLRFDPMPYDQAVLLLAEDAGVGPESRSQIEMLLAYLTASQVVSRDGELLRMVSANATQTEASGREGQPPDAQPVEKRVDHKDSAPPPRARAMFSPTGGGVSFSIRLQVEMSELATWSPDRIAAFFAGIAQVLAAKGALTEEGEEHND